MANYLSTEKSHLGIVDYAVLVAMLSVSLGIGAYYAWVDRKRQSTEEFLMGGKRMSVAPVAMSVVASFLSSTTILGWPIEVYFRGSHLWLTLIPSIFATVAAAEIFVPIFYRLNLTSVNIYLEKRFESTLVKRIASFSVLISTLLNLGVVLYGPALALGSVTGFTTTQSVFMIGFICTIYTTLGGLKAVIWTDAVQYVLMILGVVVIMIKGTIDAGGFMEVMRIAKLGGRLDMFNFEFDLYSTANVWAVVIGLSLMFTGGYGSNQMQVQRTCSMPTLRKAKEVVYLSMPGFQIMICLICYTGLVMFANYSRCDPIRTGQLSRADQLVPHFVSQSLGNDFPGLPGLFVACVFSSSLSTLSSGLNAMAAIIWDDFLKAMMPKISPGKAVLITKGLAASIGLISIGVAFLAAEVGTIFEASIMFAGAAIGPIFGVFFIGMFCHCGNGTGGIFGLLTGQVLCLWMAIGSIVIRKPRNLMLPTSTEQCLNSTVVYPGVPFESLQNARIPMYIPSGISILYHINPFYVPCLGFIVTLIVGLVVSLATGGMKGKKVDPRLMCGFVNRLRGIDKSSYEDSSFERGDALKRTNNNGPKDGHHKELGEHIEEKRVAFMSKK